MKKVLLLVCFTLSAFSIGQGISDRAEMPIVPLKRRALLIGASQYKSLGTLTYASSDAEKVSQTLTEKFGFGRENIELINESPTADGKPTVEGIRTALKSLLRDPSLNKGDLFILFFSGHGIGTSKGDYLCPTDVELKDVERDGLPVQELVSSLVDAGLKNVLVIADACRAGKSNSFGEELIKLGRKANIAVMLGCEPGKKSYEAPRLKSGVFTYFLIKALSNPKYRTSLGLVASSEIGDALKTNVAEYTRPDYGDNLQQPICETERSKDVILGAFPSSVKQADYAPVLKEAFEGMNTQKVGSVCGDLFEKLLNLDRREEAIEILKVSEAFSPDSELNLLNLAIMLNQTGRRGEADRLFRTLLNSKSDYIRSYAAVLSPSQLVQPKKRLEGAQAIWRMGQHDEGTAMAIWFGLRAYSNMGDLRSMTAMMAKDLPKASRVGLVAQADFALLTGDLSSSIEKYQEALKTTPTKALPTYLLNTVLGKIYYDLGRYPQLLDIMKQGESDTATSGLWKAQEAFYLYHMEKRPEALAMAIEAVKSKEMNGLNAVIAMEAAGVHCGELAKDLEERSAEKPLDWKLACCYLMAKLSKDQDLEFYTTKSFELRKIVDDELELRLALFDLADNILTDAIENENQPRSITNDLYNQTFRDLMTRVSEFGHNERPWLLLAKLGLTVGDAIRVHEVFEKYIAEDCRANKVGADLQQMRFNLAACAENDAVLKEVLAVEFLEPDRSDSKWSYLSYLLAVGNYSDAKSFAATLKTAPSDRLEILQRVGLAAQKFLSGDKRALDSIIEDKGDRYVHTVARQVAACMLARDGQWNLALPVLEKSYPAGILILPTSGIQCFTLYSDYLRQKGDIPKLNQVVYEGSQTNIGQKTLSKMFYGSSVKESSFVGNLKGSGQWIGDQTYDEKNPSHKSEFDGFGAGLTTVDCAIDVKGAFKGTVQITDGQTWKLDGKVDLFGYLVGTASQGQTVIPMKTKLIPNSLKIGDKPIVQMISLDFPEGRNIIFIVPQLAP